MVGLMVNGCLMDHIGTFSTRQSKRSFFPFRVHDFFDTFFVSFFPARRQWWHPEYRRSRWGQCGHARSKWTGKIPSKPMIGGWFGCHFLYCSLRVGFLVIPNDEVIFFRGVALAHQPEMIGFPASHVCQTGWVKEEGLFLVGGLEDFYLMSHPKWLIFFWGVDTTNHGYSSRDPIFLPGSRSPFLEVKGVQRQFRNKTKAVLKPLFKVGKGLWKAVFIGLDQKRVRFWTQTWSILIVDVNSP